MVCVSEMQQWANGLHFERDALGNEELLDSKDCLVMSHMERRDIEKCVGDLLLRPGCSVLEVGFGLGFSAEFIQRQQPSSHVIVECAPVVLERLRAWAKDKPSVTVIEGTWQAILPELRTFERIFFDACRSKEMSAREMERCPNAEYRAKYAEVASARAESGVFDAFEAVARQWHCAPEARISSGSLTEFMQWADGFFFSQDKDGKEQLLDVDGVQVMMEWEKPYMEECVDELCIDSNCDVLEVGFGCGYSAERIQKAGPRTHTIIECADAVLERLHVWAADKPNVRVVEGTWQARLPELGVFDCIFFDDYGLPGRAEREMQRCPVEEYRSQYSSAIEEEGGTHFEAFMNIALRWHGHEGSRMSGFMTHQLPPDAGKAEGLEVNYRYTSVAPPDHCNYFFSQNALVPLFVKRSALPDPKTDMERSTTAGSGVDLEEFGEEDVASRGGSSRSRSRSRSRSHSRRCLPAAAAFGADIEF